MLSSSIAAHQSPSSARQQVTPSRSDSPSSQSNSPTIAGPSESKGGDGKNYTTQSAKFRLDFKLGTQGPKVDIPAVIREIRNAGAGAGDDKSHLREAEPYL